MNMAAIREYFSFCSEFYEYHPFLTGIFVSLFTVLVLSLITESILLYRRSRRVKFLTFETSNGCVSVNSHAVSGLIRAICRSFKEFNLSNVYMIRRKKQIILCISVEYVCGSRTLPEAAQTFENRILDELKSTLGIVTVSSILLKVRNARSTDEISKEEPELVETPGSVE